MKALAKLFKSTPGSKSSSSGSSRSSDTHEFGDYHAPSPLQTTPLGNSTGAPIFTFLFIFLLFSTSFFVNAHKYKSINLFHLCCPLYRKKLIVHELLSCLAPSSPTPHCPLPHPGWTQSFGGVPREVLKPRWSFHCQLAHGSPTGIISSFSSMRELYQVLDLTPPPYSFHRPFLCPFPFPLSNISFTDIHLYVYLHT